MSPPGGAPFAPRCIIWSVFVEEHLIMLHTKYQGSTPCGFWQEGFLRFSYITLYKTNEPTGGPVLTLEA
jgi:hypothetical protein